MQLTQFKALTFDCYGTLIDWESGIYNALAPWLDENGKRLTRDQVLETYAEHESAQERETPERLYPELLASVHARLGEHWGIRSTAEQAAAFGASVPDWPAFPDSHDALSYLGQHYQLVILSNIDRAGFAASQQRLGVEFDAIYTAEDIGSYKPDPRNFDYLLDHLAARGIESGDILHTAQSLFHDHQQANLAGLATCWIDRRKNMPGGGATVIPDVMPHIDFHFASMAELADAHRQASGA